MFQLLVHLSNYPADEISPDDGDILAWVGKLGIT